MESLRASAEEDFWTANLVKDKDDEKTRIICFHLQQYAEKMLKAKLLERGIQNAKKDDEGNIIGGSASIVDSLYQKGKASPCKQVMKESLGRIIFMEDRKSGIFLSKTRGLVFYDVEVDEFQPVDRDDPRLKVSGYIHEARIRTLLGDCDLVLNVMYGCGILRIMRNLAVKDDALYAKMVFHTLHGC